MLDKIRGATVVRLVYRWRSINSNKTGFDTTLLARLSANVTFDPPVIKAGASNI